MITCMHRYEGLWEEHRMNGQGRFEGADGTLYVGDWFNGNMDGKGDLREPNVSLWSFVLYLPWF